MRGQASHVLQSASNGYAPPISAVKFPSIIKQVL
jgi:hypothetical protein